MVRAAAEGVIDYSSCDPWDNNWWHRHLWLLESLEHRIYQDSLAVNLQYHYSLLETSHDSNRYNSVGKAIQHNFKLWNSLNMPWKQQKDDVETDEDKTIAEAQTAYEKMYGKPGEPEYDRMYSKLEAYFKKRKADRLKRQKSRAV